MGITNITTEFTGQVGVKPRHVRIVTTDTYATIIAAGYLNSLTLMSNVIYPTDTIDIAYSGGHGLFTPIIAAGVITLTPMINSNANPSNPALAFEVMSAGGVTVNNLAKFSDVNGSIADAGARIIAGTTAVYGGGGTSNTFTVAGLTIGAKGAPVIRASTNSVSITKALPGTNTLAITFSADPGASTTVDYIYSTASLT